MDEDIAVWDDSFSVGFGLIDNQHKELVRMTNDLLQGVRRGNTAADVAFMKTIRSAVEYAQTHFSTEEKYMAFVKYPDFPAHKKEHETFIDSVREAVGNFESGKAEASALANFLKKWLFNHIAVSDKKYGPYLEKMKAAMKQLKAQKAEAG